MKVIRIKKGSEESILNELTNRTEEDLSEIDVTVKKIINTVRTEGDKGLLQLTADIEKVQLKSLKVSENEIEEAFGKIDNKFMDILNKASENIRSFHEKQSEKSWQYEKSNGVILGQLINPLESVCVYVPGGKAAYPSSVLMNVIPAKIAGVERIAMTTPPGKDGKINPYILAAAKVAGVDEIYKLGGAQAVAALAYGTETIKPVKKIVGPGNIYVARAKKYVFGLVDIDMIAGPSEICIIADESADASYVAADFLSQAEHDEMAASILVTTSEAFAQQSIQEVESQLAKLSRVDIAQKAIENNGMVILTEDMDSAFKVSNIIAPEHLELMLEKPMEYVNKVKNAGAVFLGKYAPEPLGDYMAGPNHTLPTGGTAAFASPLGVYDFIKRSSLIYYTEDALRAEKDYIIEFAEKEGLTAHGNSIKVRFGEI
ncbi:MAG: histidinol dehydrogenase [Clostridiales bacterium]|nr:histidinol dehydrogenase [Clostridiales bacterium]